MSKDKRYSRLVSSVRWQRLALETKTRAGWQCQDCGVVTRRLAVHHIRPVETGRTEEEMEALCFSRANLRVLCFDCHAGVHRGSHDKENHRLAEDRRVKRFLERDLHIDTGEGIPPD